MNKIARVLIAALGVLSMPAAPATAQSGAGWSNLEKLPREVAKTFTESLLPKTGLSRVIDLDGNGREEVVLFAHSPVVNALGEDQGEVSYQSFLLIFEKNGAEEEGFPYRVAAMRSVTSLAPRPVHLAIQDVGGDRTPEIVWLENGPDHKGRYSDAILYSFRPGGETALVEVGRFANPSGWLRIHDLDGDDIAEVIAFVEESGQTYSPDLLFFDRGSWGSLKERILEAGYGDVESFQGGHGLPLNGRVTRDLLAAFKTAAANTDRVPNPIDTTWNPPAPSAPPVLGDPFAPPVPAPVNGIEKEEEEILGPLWE